jgi:hypothetical protein
MSPTIGPHKSLSTIPPTGLRAIFHTNTSEGFCDNLKTDERGA